MPQETIGRQSEMYPPSNLVEKLMRHLCQRTQEETASQAEFNIQELSEQLGYTPESVTQAARQVNQMADERIIRVRKGKYLVQVEKLRNLRVVLRNRPYRVPDTLSTETPVPDREIRRRLTVDGTLKGSRF